MYFAVCCGRTAEGSDPRSGRLHLINVDESLRLFLREMSGFSFHEESGYTCQDALMTLNSIWFDHHSVGIGTFDGENLRAPGTLFYYTLLHARASMLRLSKDPIEQSEGQLLSNSMTYYTGQLNEVIGPCLAQAFSLAIPIQQQ